MMTSESFSGSIVDVRYKGVPHKSHFVIPKISARYDEDTHKVDFTVLAFEAHKVFEMEVFDENGKSCLKEVAEKYKDVNDFIINKLRGGDYWVWKFPVEEGDLK